MLRYLQSWIDRPMGQRLATWNGCCWMIRTRFELLPVLIGGLEAIYGETYMTELQTDLDHAERAQ